ncbi:MAG: TOBE domain-containing protein [Proteobacteria bacterium]|nr:TOBE domain-containing protein [Pseudomonadota bacterium]
MKISARNQFQGRITRLTPGPINSEVVLALPGGDELVAVVTSASARELGLAVGGSATAIVKAPWVIVVAGEGGLRFSARNQWRGSVSAVKPGAVNADVAITLPGGAVVHAVITLDALAELGLAVGTPARAIVKASHVVLAVD